MRSQGTLDASEIIAAYGNTFGSSDGRIVLADLQRSLKHRVSFVPGQPETTAFREGERHVVLLIERLIAEANAQVIDAFTGRAVRQEHAILEEGEDG